MFYFEKEEVMDAFQLLTTRHSERVLGHPAPNKAQLEKIFQATLNIPDHGRLQPYRFVVIQEEKLPLFEHQLKQAGEEKNLGEKSFQKAERICRNTPMMIVVIANFRPDLDKVPQWEQFACASCATYAIQLASNALGFHNVWISGQWLESNRLRQYLNCLPNEKIIALLPIGTAKTISIPKPRKKVLQDLVQYL